MCLPKRNENVCVCTHTASEDGNGAGNASDIKELTEPEVWVESEIC